MVNALILGCTCSKRNSGGQSKLPWDIVGGIQDLRIPSQLEKDEMDNCEQNSEGMGGGGGNEGDGQCEIPAPSPLPPGVPTGLEGAVLLVVLCS